MELKDLSGQIISCSLEVHRTLGPGLLESIYERCLARELTLAGLRFEAQARLPIMYKGLRLESSYRIDLLVEEQMIVELKCVETILPIHEAQVLTYLKLTGIEVGLLINFNVRLLRQGIKRFVLSRPRRTPRSLR